MNKQLNNEIDSLLQDGKPFAALARANQSLSEEGETSAGMALVARLEGLLGFLGRAKKTWGRALRIAPDAGMYTGLGAILVQSGDVQQGIEAFKAGLALAPNDVALLSSLGVAHLYQNDFVSARRYATRALRIDPQHYDAMLCRARAELVLGNTNLADNDITQLELVGYKQHEVLLLRAQHFSRTGDHEIALFLMAELCDAFPTSSECLAGFRRAFRAFQNDDDGLRLATFLEGLEIPLTAHSATAGAKPTPGNLQEIDVIIPVHNSPKHVETCLESILDEEDTRLGKIVLVNDGSEDETVALLQRYADARPKTVLVHTPERSGFTRAVVHGIAESTSARFVVLNSDTIVQPGWLDRLFNSLIASPRTAMVGPLSNNATWQNYGPVFAPNGGFGSSEIPDAAERDRLLPAISSLEDESLISLPILHGFCILLDRAAYEAVGGFDVDKFPEGYGETQDLSLRFVQAGYDLRVVTDCVVYHERGGSISDHRRASLTQLARETLYDTYTALNYLCLEMACCENVQLDAARKAFARTM